MKFAVGITLFNPDGRFNLFNRNIEQPSLVGTGNGMSIGFPETCIGIIVPRTEVAFCTAVGVHCFVFMHNVQSDHGKNLLY